MFRLFLASTLLLVVIACSSRQTSVATYGPPPPTSEPTPSRSEELQLILGDDLTAEEEQDLREIRTAQYEPPQNARPPELDESMEQLLADEGALLLEQDVDYDIPIVLNDRVEWWVDYFTRRIPTSFARYLVRSGAWLPYLKSELASAGLPEDLAYIVLIESGFSTQARSRANAVGPWQFIASTGREYGLRIDRWVDERRDYERATQAAIAYLSDLHAMFGSWHLAAAGYNGGQGRIQRSMLRDNAVNFWELTSIRDETRNYVPKLLAATILAKQPRRYGFRGLVYLEPTRWAKVTVSASTPLAEVAAAAEVPTDVVEALNPHLLRGRTPPGEENFPVKIPADRVEIFARNIATGEGAPQPAPLIHPVRPGETLAAIASAYGVSERSLAVANGLSASDSLSGQEQLVVPGRSPQGSDDRWVAFDESRSTEPEPPSVTMHRVRRGDTLYGLAQRYGVTVHAIRELNGLRGNRIVAGARLRIPTAR